MTLHFVTNSVVFGRSIRIADFRDLRAEHIQRFPKTLDFEGRADGIRANGFPLETIREFITDVCEWGNYPGIAARVLLHNTLDQLQMTLRLAAEYLSRETPECGAALNAMNQRHGLGSPSFASKHLRFIRPDLCPVFDAILRDALPYSFDAAGYNDFALDCSRLAAELQHARVQNPCGRPDNKWFAADVEAALFVRFNEWL